MGKQSPNKRKSEVNSNETPKKAKVVVDTPKTPVNSPVKQTPQKNNKTPKSQKKQKPQTPGKELVTNGVPGKKVQINENNQNTPASTPGKGKGEKKYPVTPAMKGNVAKSPKSQQKGKKTPPGSPNKQHEGKLEKFTGVASLDGSTATSPAKTTKKKQKNKPLLAADVAAGLNRRQKKRMLAKLKKVSLVEAKKTNVEKKAGDSAANKSIKEIAANVAGGEKPLTKTQMRKLKKMQKLATAANAETTDKPENNSVQSPKAKKNKKKGKNKENQANGAEVAAVKNNQNVKNKQQKGNQKKENQQQQQQQQQKKKKQKVEQKKVEAEDDNEEESDYEVETSIKPEKISKKMNDTEDSDNEGAEVMMDDNDDEESDDDDIEETDNSLNENNENEQKDQKKPKKQQNKKGNQVDPKDLNNARILTKGQSRYVLFVGNLPFDATKEQVTEHFTKTCEVKDVRIPTDKESKKPRGFAYLEVPNEDSYHKALALHHSFVSGRRINVLYTQGGTKNSDNKKQNIKSKNFKLQAMRRDGKLPGGVKDSQKRSVRRAKKRSFDKNTE